ncbi:hypothetical protein ACQBAR_07945 [Propionibacteriaceae bacterium Y1685]
MVTHQYLYADKIGAGPEHPTKRWGLFSKELPIPQAEKRFAMDAARRSDWFGIVRLAPGEERPSAYVQMCPRANGVVMQTLNAHGTVLASYTWGAYHEPAGTEAYEGDVDHVFLSQIYWYAYPDEEKFLSRPSCLGNVCLQFHPDGHAKQERVTKHGFNEPSTVETREFENVDVSVNWTPIPAFGDWEAFFNPEV